MNASFARCGHSAGTLSGHVTHPGPSICFSRSGILDVPSPRRPSLFSFGSSFALPTGISLTPWLLHSGCGHMTSGVWRRHCCGPLTGQSRTSWPWPAGGRNQFSPTTTSARYKGYRMASSPSGPLWRLAALSLHECCLSSPTLTFVSVQNHGKGLSGGATAVQALRPALRTILLLVRVALLCGHHHPCSTIPQHCPTP